LATEVVEISHSRIVAIPRGGPVAVIRFISVLAPNKPHLAPKVCEVLLRCGCSVGFVALGMN
jgi:hypothetical protein